MMDCCFGLPSEVCDWDGDAEASAYQQQQMKGAEGSTISFISATRRTQSSVLVFHGCYFTLGFQAQRLLLVGFNSCTLFRSELHPGHCCRRRRHVVVFRTERRKKSQKNGCGVKMQNACNMNTLTTLWPHNTCPATRPQEQGAVAHTSSNLAGKASPLLIGRVCPHAIGRALTTR
jgi:hypothetical protein